MNFFSVSSEKWIIMAMLCRVKMTSRCIRPKTAVETEIISAGSFLKVRTQCSFFTTVCQQLTPFLQNLWFSTMNTTLVRTPWGNEHSVLHILVKIATGYII